MGTNTLDIEVRPHRDGARTLTMDANAQASYTNCGCNVTIWQGRSIGNTSNKSIYIGV